MTHQDLLGHELNVGDHVVYATGTGSSKSMCVAEILEFDDFEVKRTKRTWDKKTNTYHTSEPFVVPKWKVRVQPVVFNDYRATDRWGYKDGKYQKLAEHRPKAVKLERVENLVKVTLPENVETGKRPRYV